MTRDELQTAIQEIGTCEDEVERRELLATLQENITTDLDELDTVRTDKETLIEKNEKLRDANMKLFLRVGEPADPNGQPGDPNSQNKEKLKFEDLFNEKGGLK